MRTAAVLLLLACALAAPAAASGGSGRAGSAFAALVSGFRVSPGLYREDSSAPTGSYSTAWPLSQALAAAIALGRRDQVRSLLAALDRYWDGRAYESLILPPYGPGGAVFYDDNEWIAFDLLDAAQLDPQPWLVPRARQLFELVSGGWDTNPAATCPGGVFWGAESTDRNTVSTENAALLALRLYALTHVRSYLDWAQTMDAWTTRCLRGPDGLVRDHIAGDGGVDPRTWSYNQGATIAVEAGLWRVTGSRDALARAEQTAQAALAAGFADDPPVFVAIFFRDLAALRPDPGAARSYADSAWARLQLGSGTMLDHAALADLYARLRR